jgi:competence protein ComEC
MTLIYLGVGWLVGIGLAAVCPLKWPVWLVLSVLPITAAIIQREERSQWRLHLALAFLLLGAARYRVAQPRFGPADLASYNGAGWGEFEGYVAAEPDPRPTLTQLTVMVEGMQLEGEVYRPVSGLALVEAPRYATYRYGDRLRFAGRLETPPEWDDFSYRDYLARQRIYSRVRRPIIEPLAGWGGSPVKRALLDLKGNVQGVVRGILPDPEGALLSGILLGNDQGIPAPLMEDFNATGTSHIIAISGFKYAVTQILPLRCHRTHPLS